MMFPSEDERDYEIDHPLATPSEACREFARNMGAEHPDRAWLLTSFDTWEPNPHYQGPPVRHPEEDPEDYEDAADAETLARAGGYYDDIPF